MTGTPGGSGGGPAGPFRQQGFSVRFEWGPAGARAIAGGAGVAVVVDVLSFTTAVSVAVDGGLAGYPYRFRDATAAAFARSVGATLAVSRSGDPSTGVTLSPVSIRNSLASGSLAPGDRLVLPSPNGSTIAAQFDGATLNGAGFRGRRLDGAVPVLAGCLRNAPAVARVARGLAGSEPIAVVAAGERWPDGSLRPAVEDLWGAGAVIAALGDEGLSPEASAAASAFRSVEPTLAASLASCVSGQELAVDGFGADIAVAAEYGSSSSAPLLTDGAFRAV